MATNFDLQKQQAMAELAKPVPIKAVLVQRQPNNNLRIPHIMTL